MLNPLKAVNPANEWQDWDGSTHPDGGVHPDIHRDALVAIELRDRRRMGPRRAARWEWEHHPEGHPNHQADIVRFLEM